MTRFDSHKPLLIKLLLIVVAMFAFSFALIPLYNVFCQVTGLNGKIDERHPLTYTPRYKTAQSETPSRLITVEFVVNLNQQIPILFQAEHTALQVIPGELTISSYYVKNLTQKKMIIQAIPSISPGIVAKYLKKLECFCFNKQALNPGEEMRLPLRFWLEPEFPDDVHRMTLSYTLFDVTAL
jgi:cytochrome c oxidase assembly protein subunit 11